MSSLPRLASGGAAPHHQAPSARRKLRDKGLAFLFTALFIGQFWLFTVPADILTPPDQRVFDAQALSKANDTARIVKLALMILGASILIARQSATRSLLKHVNRPYLWLLGLVAVSYLWSIAPDITMTRIIAVLSSVLYSAAFCIVFWHPQRFQSVVRPAISSLLIGSLLLGLYSPELVMEQGIGTLHNAWHGLTNQKNTFGPIATLGVTFWLHAYLTRQVKPSVSLPGFAMSLLCVYLSRSSASLLATVFVCSFMVMLLRTPKSMRRYMPYVVAAFAVLVVLYALAVLKLVSGLNFLLTPITLLTGKDQTFSNRSEIWQIVKDHIQLHPWFGTGYGAYWIGALPSSPSYTFVGQMYFYPGESHNGYLEVTNDLGFVGLALLIAYLVVFVRQALKVMKFDKPVGSLALSLFFQQAIMNLSEAAWMQINLFSIFTVMALATFVLARCLRDQQQAPRAAAISPAGMPPPRALPLRARGAPLGYR